MKTLEQIIGVNILERRKGLKMTKRKLGKLSGVDPQTITRWEKGLQIPERKNLEALAGALDCTKEELMTDPESKSEFGDTAKDLFRLIQAWEKATPGRREICLAVLEGTPTFHNKDQKRSSGEGA